MTFPNLPRCFWHRRDSTVSPSSAAFLPRVFPSSSSSSASTSSSSSTRQGGLRSAEVGGDEAQESSGGHRQHKGRKCGVRRKQPSRTERRVDREFDGVLVPSDGVCMSGSDSSDSDWSIGWFEPHSSEFSSENESENSFAVLVPCYGLPSNHGLDSRRGVYNSGQNPKPHPWDAILSSSSSYDGKKHLEQWLSSLQSH